MPCNDKPTNCAPCQDCGSTGTPILPKCQNVNLASGVFANATVTVNGEGCISAVAAGVPDPYTPDPCCAPVGGGSGPGSGLPGPPGPAGPAATVVVGAVNTGAPGTPAQVVNTGTSTSAVLNFTIPRGDPGADGAGGGGGNLDGPGLVFSDGLFQEATPSWPPVYSVTVDSSPSGFQLSATKSSATGELSLGLDATAYDSVLRADVQALLDVQQAQIDSLQASVAGMTTRLTAAEVAIEDLTDRLNTCCP